MAKKPNPFAKQEKGEKEAPPAKGGKGGKPANSQRELRGNPFAKKGK